MWCDCWTFAESGAREAGARDIAQPASSANEEEMPASKTMMFCRQGGHEKRLIANSARCKNVSTAVQFAGTEMDCNPPVLSYQDSEKKEKVVHVFDVTIGGLIQVRMEAITEDIARIYFTDKNGDLICIPDGIRLYNSADRTPVKMKGGFCGDGLELLIVRFKSYVLELDGHELIRITNQKQQAFETAIHVTHTTATT
jgi:hypothetical protein